MELWAKEYLQTKTAGFGFIESLGRGATFGSVLGGAQNMFASMSDRKPLLSVAGNTAAGMVDPSMLGIGVLGGATGNGIIRLIEKMKERQEQEQASQPEQIQPIQG